MDTHANHPTAPDELNRFACSTTVHCLTGALASHMISLLVAGAVAFPVSRWLIKQAKGHAVVREHHAHPH